MTQKDLSGTRIKLLEAARDAIRGQGYAATTVDDICARAGVSKGSFFHHFRSKEDLGLATVRQFGEMANGLFETAPYTTLDDPRDRVFGYVDFRVAILSDDIIQFTCLLGTTVQEVHATHPSLRDACNAEMATHIDMLARDLALAKARYAPAAAWTPQAVGTFMQSVLQGAFIVAKAKQSPAIVVENLGHLKTYLRHLLGSPDATARTVDGKPIPMPQPKIRKSDSARTRRPNPTATERPRTQRSTKPRNEETKR